MNDWQQSLKRYRNNNTSSPQRLRGHRTVGILLHPDTGCSAAYQQRKSCKGPPFSPGGTKCRLLYRSQTSSYFYVLKGGFLPSQCPVFAQQKLMVIHWLSSPNGPTIPINPPIFALISTSANNLLGREINQAFSDASEALILPWQKLH